MGGDARAHQDVVDAGENRAAQRGGGRHLDLGQEIDADDAAWPILASVTSMNDARTIASMERPWLRWVNAGRLRYGADAFRRAAPNLCNDVVDDALRGESVEAPLAASSIPWS